MGRPLDERVFKNLAISSCWIPGDTATTADATIVEQIGTNRYVVTNDDATSRGIVQLQKADVTAAGQAQIEVRNFTGDVEHARSIWYHLVNTWEGHQYLWNFDGSVPDQRYASLTYEAPPPPMSRMAFRKAPAAEEAPVAPTPQPPPTPAPKPTPPPAPAPKPAPQPAPTPPPAPKPAPPPPTPVPAPKPAPPPAPQPAPQPAPVPPKPAPPPAPQPAAPNPTPPPPPAQPKAPEPETVEPAKLRTLAESNPKLVAEIANVKTV